jgi:hypothetical protein
VVAL